MEQTGSVFDREKIAHWSELISMLLTRGPQVLLL